MTLFIDTDPYIYKIAFAAQPNCYWIRGQDFDTKRESIAFCKENDIPLEEIEKESFLFSPKYVRQFIKAQFRGIVDNCFRDLITESQYEGWDMDSVVWGVSSSNNKRLSIDADYKGHRPPPPRWKDFVKQEIIERVDPVIIDGLEADDVIAKRHYRMWKGEPYSSCILTIDKDLDNIPGWHYNPDRREAYYIDETDAFLNFLAQFLVGDKSDNIPGIRGIGEKKAFKWLDTNGISNMLTGFAEPDFKEVWDHFVELTLPLYEEQFSDPEGEGDQGSIPEKRFYDNFHLLDVGGIYCDIVGLAYELKELENI